jgi:hypothetical protein
VRFFMVWTSCIRLHRNPTSEPHWVKQNDWPGLGIHQHQNHLLPVWDMQIWRFIPDLLNKILWGWGLERFPFLTSSLVLSCIKTQLGDCIFKDAFLDTIPGCELPPSPAPSPQPPFSL